MAFVAIGAITDNNHVIPYPAGAAGDFLLMYWEDDNGATAAVVGWQGTSAVMSNGHRMGYLWAAAPGAGSGTVTDTGLNTGGFCTAQIERHNNTDLSTPIAAGGVEVNSNIASSISPAMAGCTEVVAISYDSYQAGSQTPPSGWTRRQDTGVGENWYAVDRFLAAAGATGTTTFGAGASGSTGMVHVALAPPGTPTAPGQVTGLTTVGKPGRADLSWSTPSSGNSAITDYLIERAPDVSGSPGTYATVTHSAQTTTTYTDSGLTNGSIYWYRISAINAIGTGTASTAVSASPIANPVVAATTFEVGTSMGSNNAIALPTGAASGDLIIVHANSDLNGAAGAITASAGYTAVTNGAQTQGTTVIGCNVFARVLDGSGSDALTVSGAAQDYVVNVIRITDHGVTSATINTALFLTGTTGTTGNANPPIVNPATSSTWLWLAAMTLDLTTGNTITVAPSGYTMAENHVSASSTTSVAGAVAYKRSAAATSEDPGTFTNTSRAWIALSIAVPPAATGHVGGPVALAGQADGVSTATGTLIAGPTVVQSVMTTPNTALGNAATLTFPNPTVTGDSIVVFGFTTDAVALTAGQVTDNKGNTYVLGPSVYDSTAQINWGWWYCLNITGGSGHQVVITAGSGKVSMGGATEVAGLATTGTYDKHSESLQIGPGSTSPNAGSTGVLSQAREIVFAGVANVAGATSNTITPQGGFTTLWDGQNANSGGQQLGWNGAYLVTSATTAVTPAWTTSASSWDALTITFRGGGGAHVGGPVALAGQADGVATATGTLSSSHVGVAVALAGQSDGVATATGTLSTPSAFDPTKITGCIGWWDPADSLVTSGSNVTSITDKSGTGHTMVATPGGGTITVGANQNGHPTVAFGGASTERLAYDGSTNIIAGPTASAAMVYYRTADPSFIRALSFGVTGSQDWNVSQYTSVFGKDPNFPATGRNGVHSGGNTPINEWHIAIAVFNGTTAQVYIDGVAQTSASDGNGNFAVQDIMIGNEPPSWGSPFSGQMGDVVAYNTALTSTDVANLNSYLTGKWISHVPGPVALAGRVGRHQYRDRNPDYSTRSRAGGSGWRV